MKPLAPGIARRSSPGGGGEREGEGEGEGGRERRVCPWIGKEIETYIYMYTCKCTVSEVFHSKS